MTNPPPQPHPRGNLNTNLQGGSQVPGGNTSPGQNPMDALLHGQAASNQAVLQAIREMTQAVEAMRQMSYQQPGMTGGAQGPAGFSQQDRLANVAFSEQLTGRASRVTNTEATTSLAQTRRWAAQRLGEAIAGPTAWGGSGADSVDFAQWYQQQQGQRRDGGANYGGYNSRTPSPAPPGYYPGHPNIPSAQPAPAAPTQQQPHQPSQPPASPVNPQPGGTAPGTPGGNQQGAGPTPVGGGASSPASPPPSGYPAGGVPGGFGGPGGNGVGGSGAPFLPGSVPGGFGGPGGPSAPPPSPPGGGHGGGSSGPGGFGGQPAGQPGPGGQGQGGPGGGPPPPRPTLRQQVGAAVAQSGGTGTGIMNQLRHIPGVGLALDATQEYQDQFEKNRVYQSMVGGSNFSGFAQRLHQGAYQASQFFSPMGSEQAGEAFQAVTAMGYTGQGGANGAGRQDMLNFIHHNYNTRGMSVQESAQFGQFAADNPSVNLAEVSRHLQELSDSAKQFGVNAQSAREGFLRLSQAAVQAGFGTSSTAVAAGMQDYLNAGGKSVAGTDISGALTPDKMYQAGAMQGRTAPEEEAIQRNNPSQWGRDVDAVINQGLEGVINTNHKTWASQEYMRLGGPQGFQENDHLWTQLARNFLDHFKTGSDQIDGQVLQKIAAQKGLDASDPTKATIAVLRQIVGDSVGNHISQQGTRSAVTNAQTGEVIGPDGKGTGEFNDAHARTQSDLQKNANARINGPGGTSTPTGTAGVFHQILTEEAKTGTSDEIRDTIANNLKDKLNNRVVVNVQGKNKVMKLSDALLDFKDEVAQGNVTWYDGPGKDLPVNDAAGAGTRTDDRTKADAGREDADPAHSKVGTDYAKAQQRDKSNSRIRNDFHNLVDWLPGGRQVMDHVLGQRDDGKGDSSGSGGKVTLDFASEEMRRVFKQVASQADSPGADGAPPAVPTTGSRTG